MPTKPLGPLKILYIEDDPNSRRLVERLLLAEGYEVYVADDGLAGLELARQIRPALVLTDVNMGTMTGHEVATRLKEMPETRHAPVIAITANTMQTDREIALVAGCDGYITKPIDVDALPHLIEQFLAGAREHVDDTVKVQRLEEYRNTLVTRLEQTVADLQHANAELRRADKMKKDFVVISSHELRTPVTLIYGYIKLLKMETDQLNLGEHLDTIVDKILTATQRMNDAVDSIINVSLIDSEQLELTFKPVDLQGVVQSIVQQMQPVALQRSQKLYMSDMSALPSVPGDANYLRRALTNVIDNAIKYTPDGGQIGIEAVNEFETMHLVISDTGIGIDRAHQERIFEKFYVLEDVAYHSTSRSGFMGGGMGLGLAVTHGIVRAHGGRIWVDSEGKDVERLPGSRFHIMLPMTAPVQREATSAEK
jgi:signal transduction histidine kinase